MGGRTVEVRSTEGAPEVVIAHMRRVRREVAAQRAGEERRVLRDEGHGAAQLREAEARDVEAVDAHAAAAELGEAEERVDDARLAGARAPHHADLHARAAVRCSGVELRVTETSYRVLQ